MRVKPDSAQRTSDQNRQFAPSPLGSQSNMEFSTNDAFNSSAEIADSINYPDLRLYTIKDTPADAPQYDGTSKANYTWNVSWPGAFEPPGGPGFSYFSATCFFFGRDLHRALGGKVPVGLVASDWGGQKVECFSSPDALADTSCGGTVAPGPAGASEMMAAAAEASATHFTPLERESLPASGQNDDPVPNPGPSQLWFGQIYPLLNLRFTGATWSVQRESNPQSPDPARPAC